MRRAGSIVWSLALASLAAVGAEDLTANLSGTVTETMEGGRYTYVQIDTGKGREWIASFHCDAKVGDRVTAHGGTPMQNFSSPTLKRTFDRILFTGDLVIGTNAPAKAGLPSGHPDIGMPTGASAPVIVGEVVETMSVKPYTYVKVQGSHETIWAAANYFEVKKGDRVSVPQGSLMKDFESPSLKRTFKEIYFVGTITKEGQAGSAAPHHAAVSGVAPHIKAGSIEKPAGGLTVAEVFARGKELAGKPALVRGQVVKFTADIMGRNWIHLADGTGEVGQNELTVTTESEAQVGDTVTAKGVVAVDQNFGLNYQYPVLLEKAVLEAAP